MRRSLWSYGAGALALLIANVAHAQTFPADAQWLPITRDGVTVTDPLGDAQNERDIVGDAQNPAAYVYRDSTYLYFRLRVDDDPKQNATTYKPFGWGVAFDTDGNLDNFEYLAMLDGIANPDIVSLQKNTTQGTKGSARDGAEEVLKTYPTSTHARATQAASQLGGDPDYFVDWAVTLEDLRTAGVDLSKPIRFIFGTSNNAQTLASDLIAPSSETTIAEIISDPVNCGGTTCQSCAAFCGSACISCSGATPACDVNAGVCVACTSDTQCAAPTPACDLASKQCVECASSTDCAAPTPVCDPASQKCVAATPCDADADCTSPTLPACTASGNCGECSESNDTRCGDTTICNVPIGECTTSGNDCSTDSECTNPKLPICSPAKKCVPCGVDSDCKDPKFPVCQSDGACGECGETKQDVCTGASLLCNVPSGTCGETCTGDANCTNAERPACQPSGVCAECSASNTTQCQTDTPICDTTRGQCVGSGAGAGGSAGSGAGAGGAAGTSAAAGGGGVPPSGGAAGRPGGTATFEGSGISCAFSRGNGALTFMSVLFGALLLAARLRRRTPD